MHEVIDPDCRDGKHGACPEWTWDDRFDKSATCQCRCHRDEEQT